MKYKKLMPSVWVNQVAHFAVKSSKKLDSAEVGSHDLGVGVRLIDSLANTTSSIKGKNYKLY